MGHNLAHLALQGRAYSAGRPWHAEELEAWLLLQRERNLSRVRAAEYVRNGIVTVEDFDKATKNEFKPKSIEQAHEEAEQSLKEEGKKAVKKTVKKRSKKSK
jgi:hypothetical protein